MKLSPPSFQPVAPERGRSLARSAHPHRELSGFFDAPFPVRALRPGTGRAPWVMVMGRARRAFTLIEIMVVTVLLAVIIIGLVSMFAQTQKAFRASMTQVDVLESGRAVTELLTRDLEQISPSYGPNNTINFFAKVPNVPPLIQPITGNPISAGRVNVMEDMFFLARENQTWTGYGYTITNYGDGIGSLHRFSKSLGFGGNPGSLITSYFNTPIANMSRIVDGVVHFKVRCFDTTNGWTTRPFSTQFPPNSDVRTNFTTGSPIVQGEVEYYAYYSNAVPAFVELELGVLEERSRDRALAIPAGTARSNYLAQQASKVHLFRIRVPIRNVDPAAYQ